ncbi:MAG TPA: hypothetical protein VM818_04780 [Vicinamibacterales bacterium]|nr:hypothetical protein [Vicinamibacterales bacterium]
MDDCATGYIPRADSKRTPQAVVEVEGVTLRGISRKEVAQFVLDVLEQHRFVRQAVFIGHP